MYFGSSLVFFSNIAKNKMRKREEKKIGWKWYEVGFLLLVSVFLFMSFSVSVSVSVFFCLCLFLSVPVCVYPINPQGRR